MNNLCRKESDIFSDLEKVCTSPGYIHAIAYLDFKNFWTDFTSNDLSEKSITDKLTRTEISILIGLLCKKAIRTIEPHPPLLQTYINRTEDLLKELLQSMLSEEMFSPNNINDENYLGAVLRACIFGSGESAYYFQYRDLVKKKYENDETWFLENKGFGIKEAINIINAIRLIEIEKMNILVDQSIYKSTFLPAYIFTTQEVSTYSNVDIDVVRFFLQSFELPMITDVPGILYCRETEMDKFNCIDDFNPCAAYPILKISQDKHLLFQVDSLWEALYTTPFFWFKKDTEYYPIAMVHRGNFVEEFAAERLKLVFGENRVFLNVTIYDSKKKLGEIDVLVIFDNIAIIVQAKAKSLTLNSKKGNIENLNDDFQKAIQHSYNQAYSCAELLNNKNYKLIDKNKNELTLNRDYEVIYPFCIISDHYPSLALQVKMFLKYQETENIKAPFVMDVFLLDVATEMLQSPLDFLEYIKKRVN